MKRAEQQVRKKIAEILVSRLDIDKRAETIGPFTLVYSKFSDWAFAVECYSYGIGFLKMGVVDGKPEEMIIYNMGKGLTQLKWFLDVLLKS